MRQAQHLEVDGEGRCQGDDGNCQAEAGTGERAKAGQVTQSEDQVRPLDRYQMPSMSLASSLAIVRGSHGGDQTRSTWTLRAPGKPAAIP